MTRAEARELLTENADHWEASTRTMNRLVASLEETNPYHPFIGDVDVRKHITWLRKPVVEVFRMKTGTRCLNRFRATRA